MEMLGGKDVAAQCRKPEIMADAAYAILCKDSRSYTGNFAVDDDVLRAEGITNFDEYAVNPGKWLWVISRCMYSCPIKAWNQVCGYVSGSKQSNFTDESLRTYSFGSKFWVIHWQNSIVYRPQARYCHTPASYSWATVQCK